MDKIFIIANWKSNMSLLEAQNWLEEFSNFSSEVRNFPDKKVIICPSFVFLSQIRNILTEKKIPVSLGSQDVSTFDKGAYTGEVNAMQIKEFCEYSLIGHSERRTNFEETEDRLSKKIEMARKYGLKTILCVRGTDDLKDNKSEIIAYEPVFAIGTGNPDTPENANLIAGQIKDQKKAEYVIYGGSINSGNVKNFTSAPNIDGVLVGGASLDPQEFFLIVKNA